jgi:hypothetical protein
MSTEEGTPGYTGPPRRRWEPVPPEQRPDRGSRDRVPQLEQFATNPLVAPAGVLLRQLQDQGARRGRERRAPRPATPVEQGPLTADQLAVPPQERLGSDGEHRPAGSREAPAQGREDQAVARAPGEAFSAPEDAHLVA